MELFVGLGASRVCDLFGQAKQDAPCIVFMDEIDAVGRHRSAGPAGETEETVFPEQRPAPELPKPHATRSASGSRGGARQPARRPSSSNRLCQRDAQVRPGGRASTDGEGGGSTRAATLAL